MIASEKSHQNLSDYNQFKKKRYEVDKKQIFTSEKKGEIQVCIYDYAHLFYGKDF